MNTPKTIIRISDAEKFILQDNGKYSMELMLPYKKKGHLIGEWTLKNLSNPKYFKIL
jgi:hypothetical protein